LTPLGCTSSTSTGPPAPARRLGCLLTPAVIPLFECHPLDPGALGNHEFGTRSNVSGYVYTCEAGFIDLDHLRDVADLTRYYHYWLTTGGRNTAGATFDPWEYPGTVTLRGAVSAGQRIEVARSMAYTHSVFHEIYTYWMPKLGHSSSFSPEDLTSNYLGTYVAGQALAPAGGSVTSELNTLLTSLGAQPPATATAVLSLIGPTPTGRGWIKGFTLDDALSPDFLRRRNFDVNPIVPWRVPSAPGCPATPAWPAGVPKDFPSTITGLYEMKLEPPTGGKRLHSDFDTVVGSWKLSNTAFDAHIKNKIEPDANAKYGSTYKTR
jgi:hypothetical protein